MRFFKTRGHNELCPYKGCSPQYVVIIFYHFHNVLIINMLFPVLQKAVFWPLKGGLLGCKRPPFAMRLTVFCSPTNLPKGRLLITMSPLLTSPRGGIWLLLFINYHVYLWFCILSPPLGEVGRGLPLRSGGGFSFTLALYSSPGFRQPRASSARLRRRS